MLTPTHTHTPRHPRAQNIPRRLDQSESARRGHPEVNREREKERAKSRELLDAVLMLLAGGCRCRCYAKCVHILTLVQSTHPPLCHAAAAPAQSTAHVCVRVYMFNLNAPVAAGCRAASGPRKTYSAHAARRMWRAFSVAEGGRRIRRRSGLCTTKTQPTHPTQPTAQPPNASRCRCVCYTRECCESVCVCVCVAYHLHFATRERVSKRERASATTSHHHHLHMCVCVFVWQ